MLTVIQTLTVLIIDSLPCQSLSHRLPYWCSIFSYTPDQSALKRATRIAVLLTQQIDTLFCLFVAHRKFWCKDNQRQDRTAWDVATFRWEEYTLDTLFR